MDPAASGLVGRGTRASEIAPDYAEAWRERGILENKVAAVAKRPLNVDPAPGEASLRRAVAINDKGFDAHASLGGVLERAGRLQQSCDAYDKSQQVSSTFDFDQCLTSVLAACMFGVGAANRAVAQGKRKSCISSEPSWLS